MGTNTSNLSTVVRLKNKGLKDLEKIKQPRLLPLFTRLQAILLQNNKLSLIPQSFCDDIKKAPRVIEFLTEVNLSHNRFVTLPPEFFLLINIQRLSLDHNCLTEFPPELLSFYRLEKLTLDHNKIKELPWCMHRLKRLKILHLAHNEIDYVPNSVAKLNLSDFKLTPNPLGTIDNDDVLMAAYQGQTEILLDFLLYQKSPKQFRDSVNAEEKRKTEKRKQYTEDALLLRKILKHPEGVSLFEGQMKKEFSIENFLFWKEVNTYRETFSSDSEITTAELIQAAKKIYDDFIADGGQYTTNLPANVTVELTRIFTDQFYYPRGINQWTFDAAYKAIVDLMSRDTFRRFKGSEEGKEIIGKIKEAEDKEAQKRAK